MSWDETYRAVKLLSRVRKSINQSIKTHHLTTISPYANPRSPTFVRDAVKIIAYKTKKDGFKRFKSGKRIRAKVTPEAVVLISEILDKGIVDPCRTLLSQNVPHRDAFQSLLPGNLFKVLDAYTKNKKYGRHEFIPFDPRYFDECSDDDCFMYCSIALEYLAREIVVTCAEVARDTRQPTVIDGQTVIYAFWEDEDLHRLYDINTFLTGTAFGAKFQKLGASVEDRVNDFQTGRELSAFVRLQLGL